MTKLAIIGGSGFDKLPNAVVEQKAVSTPYGQPSAPLSFCKYGVTELIFLPRHGDDHAIAPHRINYRANIYALKDAGVTEIIALAASGGIKRDFPPQSIAIPHQIIDYTSARQHTFYDGIVANSYVDNQVHHIDFTKPYDRQLRSRLIQAAQHVAQRTTMTLNSSGVYAVTQGPRLETAAEIDHMECDGADIVGMTAMPEAALARELNISYAGLAMVVNAAAGRGDEGLTMDTIHANLTVTTRYAWAILERFILLF